MSRYVVSLIDVAPDAPVGGKARALAAMAAAGMPVPDGFLVLPAAFDATAGSGERDEALFARMSVASDVRAEIDAALGNDPSTRWAVRSSARDEDGTRDSFAGQLESFVGIAASDVPRFVVRVWASGFSARVARYRAERGLDSRPAVPAVLVQRMVEGDASGVVFSADPVSGRRAVAVVSATTGRAAPLVQGDVGGECWRVSRAGAIVERPAVAATLADADVVRVAALARDAQRLFGAPQDVEWTLAGGALHVLQSRAITTLAAMPDPDGPRAIWDNANIIESYSGITTPLTFSFARHCYEHVYREFCRLMGVPAAAVRAHDDIFRCMLGLHRGRVYYNLASWYRLLALLPGFVANRRFMEQMMGVRDPLPDEVLGADAIDRSGMLARIALARTLATIAWRVATLRSRMRAFRVRLDRALAPASPDLASMRADELVAHYRALESTLLRNWDAPIVNDFATMLFHGLLRWLSSRWLYDVRGDVASALLAGASGFVSEEPAKRVRALAALAAGDSEIVAMLDKASAAAIRRGLGDRPALASAFDAYLERFGERCVDELKLESATLADDPLPLYRAVGALAQRKSAAPAPASSTASAAERARELLSAHPLRRALFALVLREARSRVRAREDLRFERTRVFGRARRVFVELGRRLCDLELVGDPADIFYLDLDEILGLVENRATTTDVRALARVRRAEYESYAELPAPAERFDTRGIACRGHAFVPTRQPPRPRGGRLSGIGCCPGVVRGRVRVVRDPRSAQIRDGEIIVAERTDPGWVMVFPLAKGLLVERGSLLSHSAIVARELGLPTIVALPGLTAWLRDGDTVELDGASGVVTRIRLERDRVEVAATL